jgi:threonine/homoserine/homoserine lactone efflux protein
MSLGLGVAGAMLGTYVGANIAPIFWNPLWQIYNAVPGSLPAVGRALKYGGAAYGAYKGWRLGKTMQAREEKISELNTELHRKQHKHKHVATG